jgi:hypothetical protein
MNWTIPILAMMTVAAAPSHDLHLCLENPTKLEPMLLSAFQKETVRILASSGRHSAFVPCAPDVVVLTLRREPPSEEPSALGATRTRDGRLLPEIELFAKPVAELVGYRLPGLVGRALARVAVHELGHYVFQDPRHRTRGVMMERLSAAHLLAGDPGFFRLASPH